MAKLKSKELFGGKGGFTGTRREIEPDESAAFITGPQVCRRYGGRSDMWLKRIMESDPEFPRPMIINRLRYFRVADLVAWERKRAADRAA